MIIFVQENHRSQRSIASGVQCCGLSSAGQFIRASGYLVGEGQRIQRGVISLCDRQEHPRGASCGQNDGAFLRKRDHVP